MRIGASAPERSRSQHARLVALLRALGAEVEVLPFVHGAFDSVFAKDSAVLSRRSGRRRALLAAPVHAERRAEQASRREGLASLGFEVESPPVTPLEGGDVVVQPRSAGGPLALLGYGFRSSRRSLTALERFLDLPVTPLELREPRLYHLDMAVAALGETTLVCAEALTAASMRDLERAVGKGHLIRVSHAEALGFALNFIGLGRDVVLAEGVPAFEDRLRAAGYRPRPLPLSEFQLAGGSAACLAARVHALDRDSVSTTAAIRSTAA